MEGLSVNRKGHRRPDCSVPSIPFFPSQFNGNSPPRRRPSRITDSAPLQPTICICSSGSANLFRYISPSIFLACHDRPLRPFPLSWRKDRCWKLCRVCPSQIPAWQLPRYLVGSKTCEPAGKVVLASEARHARILNFSPGLFVPIKDVRCIPQS
jgi:hypothetical protein